jgi:fucose 4-O-acetylase-like acetyltransferase
MSSDYSEKLDLLKGIAIILVVAGHYMPLHNGEAWKSIVAGIYAFHMPLFMMISGYLYKKTSCGHAAGNHLSYLFNKAKRLLIPYYIISGLVLVLKILAQAFGANLEFPVSDDFFYRIFVNPLGGYATFLWFIYVLFLIFIIYPGLARIVRNNYILAIILFLASLIPLTDEFCLSRLFKYMFYFHCGVVLFSDWKALTVMPSNMNIGLSVLAFAGLLAAQLTGNSEFHEYGAVLNVLLALAGSLALWFLAWRITYKPFVKAFGSIGAFSAPIYLLHTSAVGPFKVAERHFADITPFQQFGWGLLAILAGIIIPIVVTKLVLNRYRIISLAVLGVPETKSRVFSALKNKAFRGTHAAQS